MSKAGDTATKFLIDLGARAFEGVAKNAIEKGIGKLGEIGVGLHDRVRDDTYKRYTEPLNVSTRSGATQDPATGKWVGENPRDVGEFYTDKGKKLKPPLRPEVEGDNPWNAPRYHSDTGQWRARATGSPKEGEEWKQVFYDHPEMTAQVAGYAAPAAAVGATLAAGSWLFGSQEKPQSSYRVPVQPSKYQGGYNPSVESALASASAKYELEEQKHANDMELQRLRMEAKTPGKQGSDPFGAKGDPFGDPFRTPHSYGMM